MRPDKAPPVCARSLRNERVDNAADQLCEHIQALSAAAQASSSRQCVPTIRTIRHLYSSWFLRDTGRHHTAPDSVLADTVCAACAVSCPLKEMKCRFYEHGQLAKTTLHVMCCSFHATLLRLAGSALSEDFASIEQSLDSPISSLVPSADWLAGA